MKKKRFSEVQIVKILTAGEVGVPVPDLSRQYGFDKSTYYVWKNKHGAMTLQALKKLKELEQENQRLKRRYATLSMNHTVVKKVVKKS